ncbi:hypothetical protein TNIN_462861 [Trichonephila inaurata madagascariensis]|uniref:Uncharacterized protein n=1 Tax=Trichonephila inaurata madagascariensis TaxID=2747483 RepID=A0A8X6MHB5_9ARAC|nr:hypothetical protein TNIN_462861 [Trichonephila inaurata madagascariensis]
MTADTSAAPSCQMQMLFQAMSFGLLAQTVLLHVTVTAITRVAIDVSDKVGIVTLIVQALQYISVCIAILSGPKPTAYRTTL